MEHGEWQDWLADNFDLSYRTAHNYVTAAEYVARKGKSETISHLTNLSPTVLYALANGGYSEEAEKAIIDEARKGRVDQTCADDIAESLDEDEAEADTDDRGDEDAAEDDAAVAEDDPEIAAILDGPSPDVPPSAPIAPPDFAVQSFNEAVDALKKLVTKPAAQFVTTTPVDDLMKVIAFLQVVLERASANQTKQRDKQ